MNQATISEQVAAFLAAGNSIAVVEGFEGIKALPERHHPAPDPDRKPRRRKLKKGSISERPQRTGKITDHIETLRYLAQTHTSTQAAAAIGYSQTTVKDAATRYGIRFLSAWEQKALSIDIEEVKRLAMVDNITGVSTTMGIPRSTLGWLAKRYEFKFCDGYGAGARNLRRMNRLGGNSG